MDDDYGAMSVSQLMSVYTEQDAMRIGGYASQNNKSSCWDCCDCCDCDCCCDDAESCCGLIICGAIAVGVAGFYFGWF